MYKICVGFCSVLTLVALHTAVLAQAPSVEVTTDSGAYYFGDSGDVILSVTNGPEDYPVDFYLALLEPDGTPYFYPSWGNVMLPALSGVVLPPNFSMEPFAYFTFPIPGGDPPILSDGAFAFAAAFTDAGTTNIIQDISFAYFDVSSESQGCLPGMVRIPAGTFTMGDLTDVGYKDEYPLHDVYLDSFCIDVYEYPNTAGTVPDAGLSWIEAESLCALQGKRLCSEAQWEKACQGPLGSIYPYGDWYDNVKCWTEAGYNDGEPGESGSRSRCVNVYGVFDMSGNAWEWVSDYYDGEYYASSPYENPTGPFVGSSKVMRGGAWFHGGLASRCSFRAAYDPERGRFGAGVRCCAD